MKRILYVVTLVALALAAPLTAWKVGGSDAAHAGPAPPGEPCTITATHAVGQDPVDQFKWDERVYINGKGFPAPTELTFTVTHLETATVVNSDSFSSGPDGGFTAILVWDGANAFEGDKAYGIVVTPTEGGCRAADDIQYLDDRPPPPRQVTICHATRSATNPYRMPSPAILNNGDLLGGHLNHTGPVYPKDNWGDIIPPYEYRTPSGQLLRSPGYNWPAGEAIYQNDCHPPGLPPTPEVTIRICHATGEEALPYLLEDPAILEGGALEDLHRTHMGDIIPPYTYFDADDEPHEFGGQNWDARGQVIWQTPNCVPPPPDPPPDPKPITPLAGCVELLVGGGFRAHFGYQNPNREISVPATEGDVPPSEQNAFSPPPPNRDQTTEFKPGPVQNAFTADSTDGAPLTWNLTGNEATATIDSPRCGGSITITKLLNPSDDPGLFNLEIDGGSVRAEGPAGDGDTTGPIAVTAGTHTVGESGAATNLSRYDTQIVCRPNSGAGAVVAGANSVSVQVTVGSGDAVVCTITNTRKQPRPLTPVLECVVINEGGLDVAVWGYENPNDHAVEIDVGNLNRFSPGDQDRGQPTTFEPGPFASVFQTPFEAGAGGLTWTLTGNTATASSNSPPCTPPQPPPQPPPDVLDLELKKTASPTTVRVGELITWTMTVTNPSTVAAGDVSGARVDDRPFRMEMVSLTTSQGTCSPPDGCNLGRLLPGASVTVTAVTRATQVGEVVNCVRVGSEEIESGYLNNTACAVAHVIGDAPPILDRCRSLVVSPRLLRAAREAIVLTTARDLLGRPLAGISVRARGAGITALAKTNARGIARFVFIAPRLGTIRFRGVGQGTRTISASGCKTRLGVLPGRQPPPLTGRSD